MNQNTILIAANTLPRVETPRQDIWWDPALYPFESRFLDLPAGRVHYVDEGSGPVLLFLPPAPLWSFMYRQVILGLRGRFRCIALDFPGFGTFNLAV